MKKIPFVLTFDYELPMGGCRDYQKGLFEPASKILELAKETNTPVVLFADVCSVQMFQKWDYNNYIIPFSKQIQKALMNNNDVQLHVHPHWLTSEYRNGNYTPSTKFCLADYKNEKYPNNIDGIISNSVNLLTELCRKTQSDYRCVAYRGGGYNIQPDTDKIFTALFNNGIRIDSSILKYYYFKSQFQLEDYRVTPKQANWFISLEGEFTKVSENGIFEIPPTSMPPYIHQRIGRMVKKVKNKKLYAKMRYDHTGRSYPVKVPGFKSKVFQAIYSPVSLSFDSFTTDMSAIESIIKYSLKKYGNEMILCATSHPKVFGEYQFSLLRDTISLVKTKYSDIIEFSTFQKIANERNL